MQVALRAAEDPKEFPRLGVAMAASASQQLSAAIDAKTARLWSVVDTPIKSEDAIPTARSLLR
jgi:hypothetical protein